MPAGRAQTSNPRSAARGTLDEAQTRELWRYFCEGGVENCGTSALQICRASDRSGPNARRAAGRCHQPVSGQGRANEQRAAEAVPIVFYRALLAASADTEPDRSVAGLRSTPAVSTGVDLSHQPEGSSARSPSCAARLAAHPPHVIIKPPRLQRRRRAMSRCAGRVRLSGPAGRISRISRRMGSFAARALSARSRHACRVARGRWADLPTPLRSRSRWNLAGFAPTMLRADRRTASMPPPISRCLGASCAGEAARTSAASPSCSRIIRIVMGVSPTASVSIRPKA